MKIKIYTDGACSGNPGKGGWGALIQENDNETMISGSAMNTTNNRMELTAVIKALELYEKPREIEIFTDSKYVMQGITEWIKNWKHNQWKTSQKKDVKNKKFSIFDMRNIYSVSKMKDQKIKYFSIGN